MYVCMYVRKHDDVSKPNSGSISLHLWLES